LASDSLKALLEAFASKHSLSLARTVVELLEHGLDKVAYEPAAGPAKLTPVPVLPWGEVWVGANGSR
jgi:hypothetical protein